MNSKRRGHECPIQFLKSLSYFLPIHLLADYGKLATARLKTIILLIVVFCLVPTAQFMALQLQLF